MENNQDIMNEIQKIQAIEKEYIIQLINQSSQFVDVTQKENLINKIDELTNLRIEMYKLIYKQNKNIQNSVMNSQQILNEQNTAVQIMENQLNQFKNQIHYLEEDKNNKIRLIENNDYYGERYKEHGEVMKYIVLYLLGFCVLMYGYKKGWFNSRIFYLFIILLTLVSSYIIIPILFSIWSRDNLNYNEYNWYFNPNTAPKMNSDISDENNSLWEKNKSSCEIQNELKISNEQ
jgi:hypothetical protein